MAEQVNDLLGLEHLSRVDIILGKEGPTVLEVNAVPGFTDHSLIPLAAAQAGIDFAELCARLLAVGWARAKGDRVVDRGLQIAE